MTNEQKNKILDLRAAGAGYKKIAAELGISRDRVRYFCKIDGFSEKAAPNNGESLFCEQCSGELRKSRRGRARRFCSEKCRRVWWAAHPEARNPNPDAVYNIICTGCGRTFESYGNKNRKFCEHSCYVSTRFAAETIRFEAEVRNGI